MLRRLVPALALLAVLPLAGCSAAAAGAAKSPSPTPSTVVAHPYSTAALLKDAWVKAGFDCPTWNGDDAVSSASSSGTCSDSDVFMVFANASARDAEVATLKAFGGVDETDLLVGPNWVINDPAAASASPLLGGNVVTISADSSATDSSDSASSFDYNDAGITLTLKTTSKQCFGSAGCDITVKPVLGVEDPSTIPDGATGTITYTISGDSSGPIIDTIDLTGSSYSASETNLSTDSSSTKVTVKVTDITTDGQ